MTFSVPLAAALDAHKDAWALARITLRDGSVLKLARADVKTPDGQYLGVCRSMGTYTDEVSDVEGALVTPTGGPLVVVEQPSSPIVSDAIARLGDLRGSPVVVYLAADSVSTTDWDTRFVGVVSRASMREPFVWTINLQFDDRQIDTDFPAHGTPRYDFEQATDIVIAPLRYGHHLSEGITGEGMCGPAPMIDPDDPDFLLARASIPITRFFVAGADVTPVSGGVEFQDRNGRRYTAGEGDEFSPPVTDDSEPVTFDTNGILYGATTLDDTIIRPTEVIKHILDNWIYRIYENEPQWFWDTAPIEPTYLTEASTYLDIRGYQVGKSFTQPENARGAIEGWSWNHQIPVFWTPSGELAFRPINLTLDPYDGRPLRWDRDSMGSPTYEGPKESDRIGAVHARYCFIEPRGEFAFDLLVADAFTTDEGTIDMDLDWSARFLTT